MKGTAVSCPTCSVDFRSLKRPGRRVFCPSCLGSARVPSVDDEPMVRARPTAQAAARLVARPVEAAGVFELIDSEESLEPVSRSLFKPDVVDDDPWTDEEEEEEQQGFFAEVWHSMSPLGKIKTAIGCGIMVLALPMAIIAALIDSVR